MKKLASLSVAFIVGMAVLSLPTLALAQGIEVLIGDTAELTDAGVVVPVTVTCVAAIPAEPPSPVITGSAALAFRKHRCDNTP